MTSDGWGWCGGLNRGSCARCGKACKTGLHFEQIKLVLFFFFVVVFFVVENLLIFWLKIMKLP
jgi:hypothetical protein